MYVGKRTRQAGTVPLTFMHLFELLAEVGRGSKKVKLFMHFVDYWNFAVDSK